MVTIKELYKVENEEINRLLNRYTYPYEILDKINDYILELGKTLGSDYEKIGENIWIHKTAKIADGVEIIGPAIIMEKANIRHNAYLRENVIIGKECVVGNSCEIKNSILIEKCEVPHFNYVGDSILGSYSHLGAGVVISNLKLDKKNIKIDNVDTNLRKIGAFIGDNVQIGCNSVINPGTIIMPNAIIYPLSNIRGIILDNKIVKSNGIIVERL